MTALARARESERTFFSPRRVDRAGREWGRSGNHRRAASRRRSGRRATRLTTIFDDARGARAASRRARRRPRSISESASLRLPRRVSWRMFDEEGSRASLDDARERGKSEETMNDANAVGSSGGRGARRPRDEASDEDAGQHRLDARRPRTATRRVFDALASLPGDATWRDIVNAVCVLVTRYLPFDATIRHPERESRRRGRARASPHGARPTLRRRRDGDIAHDDACSCVIAHGLRASRKTQSFIKTTSESRRKRRDGDAAERRGTARRRRRRGDVRLFSFHFNSFHFISMHFQFTRERETRFSPFNRFG